MTFFQDAFRLNFAVRIGMVESDTSQVVIYLIYVSIFWSDASESYQQKFRNIECWCMRRLSSACFSLSEDVNFFVANVKY